MAENMIENARYIYSFFIGKGWTSNSICGLLGNMQAESGIIADINEIGGGGGYGLVQWTPKSILTNWANQNGLDYTTVETQWEKIQWELENGQQFYATSAYPMNFKQFTQSTDSAAYLAKVFTSNYERPANSSQPQRSVWAEEWYSMLVLGTPIPDNLNVYTIQCQLKAMTHEDLTEDGVMGPVTKSRIKQFEEIGGISVDGIWGTQCANITEQIYEKALCGLPYHEPIPTRLIQFRMGISIDGIFGNHTANSVEVWQKANGLAIDGIVGPLSWNKLLS
jgi:peptidoglycan hydrolase-like protein with peptidoglycan-binding domain